MRLFSLLIVCFQLTQSPTFSQALSAGIVDSGGGAAQTGEARFLLSVGQSAAGAFGYWGPVQLRQTGAGFAYSSAGAPSRAEGFPKPASSLSPLPARGHIDSIAPASGPAGTGFELNGSGFGPYSGGATQVTVGGVPAALSAWNDSQIRGIIPDGLADGVYPVTAALSPSGAKSASSQVLFTVQAPPPSASGPASAPHPVKYYQAALPLSIREGGRVEAESRASVVVAARALDADSTISIDKAPGDKDEKDRQAAAASQGLGAAGEAALFGPEGARFNSPVTVELPYFPALTPAGAAAPAIHYWDRYARSWLPLQTELDAGHRKARAKTDHFSVYQLLAPGASSAGAASPDFSFGGLRVFPNPARGGLPATIRVQAGRADSVEIGIMDMTGRVVHSAAMSNARMIDDGDGRGPQWTFDCNWDTSHAGTGIYLLKVTAHKAGQGDIRKNGRVAVIH